jgi:hypothetical protein
MEALKAIPSGEMKLVLLVWRWGKIIEFLVQVLLKPRGPMAHRHTGSQSL